MITAWCLIRAVWLMRKTFKLQLFIASRAATSNCMRNVWCSARSSFIGYACASCFYTFINFSLTHACFRCNSEPASYDEFQGVSLSLSAQRNLTTVVQSQTREGLCLFDLGFNLPEGRAPCCAFSNYPLHMADMLYCINFCLLWLPNNI